MKKFKHLALLLALVLSLGIFLACEKPESQKEEVVESPVEETQSGSEITVTDMMGREINFTEVPSKVIVLKPSESEILDAIGGIDSLIGRGTYVDYPESVLDLPVVATGRDTNAEEIIALEPDLVLMSDMAQTEEQISSLENAGIKVVMTSAATIDEVYKSIEVVGKVMRLEENAEGVIAQMKSDFEELSKTAEQNAGKTIYFEISPLEYGLWSGGSGTFMDEIGNILGLENIFSDIEGWSEVSEEEVIARNPDYIVTIAMGSTEGETPVEEILGRAGWEGISAVQNEKVLNLTDDSLSRPSPRLVQGAKALSEFISE
ncbi:MAG: ABC transporter substrate-binding protein [Tissierellia bacterium]|jgi:iron complex transport system substrate-binding protein|nr:ABC transporter substrate-binding protein [Tissierellia bacterium]